jgi:hypothetical protein
MEDERRKADKMCKKEEGRRTKGKERTEDEYIHIMC